MAAQARSRRAPVRVLVCRGCCCGTSRKHPHTDHDGQLNEIAQAVEGRGHVQTVDCVGRCDRSNVIVIRRTNRAALWIGPVLEQGDTAALCEWLGGGACDPLPAPIESLVFDRHDDRPSRRRLAVVER